VNVERARGRFACLCCGHVTLPEQPPGSFAICLVCFWEDDDVQARDPTFRGGANVVSLLEGRKNFRRFGASEERCRGFVRPPRRTSSPS
jgi:Cysteine-rich CPCC